MRPWVLGVGCLLGSSAFAGAPDVYVNGARVTGLTGQVLEDVDVRFDEDGNVWIDAPRYKVEAVASSRPALGVPTERYWLVSQDNDSRGHVVEVQVNGVSVQTVRSGDAPLIVDLAPFLRPGPNEIALDAAPAPDATGGPLSVHIGEGVNRNGTIELANPDVSIVRRSGRADQPTTQRGRLVVR